MIDFTVEEYKELCYIRDKLSRMCAVRNMEYGCEKCPMIDNTLFCPYLAIDERAMSWEMRHKMTDKEQLKNALKVLVNYCNQYNSDVCHDYSCKDITPPHECMFWHTCHFDCHLMCDRLRDELENLEKEEKMNHE